jgi:hypothetical protein
MHYPVIVCDRQGAGRRQEQAERRRRGNQDQAEESSPKKNVESSLTLVSCFRSLVLERERERLLVAAPFFSFFFFGMHYPVIVCGRQAGGRGQAGGRQEAGAGGTSEERKSRSSRGKLAKKNVESSLTLVSCIRSLVSSS